METLLQDPTVQVAALHLAIAAAQLVLVVAPLVIKRISPTPPTA